MLGHMIRRLSDSILLPYDIESYAVAMQHAVQSLKYDTKINTILQMPMQNVTLSYLERAVEVFAIEANNWTRRIHEMENSTIKNDPILARMINDQVN